MATSTTQSVLAWAGNQKGQTLDSKNSFVSVGGDGTGTMIIQGHLYHTNQPNAQLQLYYKLDGSAPIQTGVNFQTTSVGTGDFAYSVEGFSPGSTHTVVIEINTAPGAGQTYYVNAAASTDAGTGISFTV
jgi:hypothetical protein